MTRSVSGGNSSLRENKVVTVEMKQEASLPVTTFGVGRHCYDKVAATCTGWNHQPHDRVYPGPANYTDGRKDQKDKYSLRDRTVKNLF